MCRECFPLQKRPIFCKETYISKHPTNRSHPIDTWSLLYVVKMIFHRYGGATISRLLQIIGLLCKRALLTRLYSAKETHNFKEPTNRSHPIDSGSLLYVVKIILHKNRLSSGVATISRLLKFSKSLLQNIVSFIGLFCERDQ